MQLRFLGGAGTVTGSKVMVEHQGRRLLLDCGLFDGLKQLRLHNRSALAVPSRSIDAVVLTQADLAHSGFLPRLVELGFEGAVHATPATVELCHALLPEAGRQQEEQARQANRLGYGKHAPARPLFTEDMARRALRQLRARSFSESFEPVPGIGASLQPCGQQLGGASVHLRCGTAHSLLYASALGRSDDPLLPAPAAPEPADQMLVPATYGNRQHRQADAVLRLSRLITRTAARGGTLLLAAPPAGPVVLLLHALRALRASARLPPELPVRIDGALVAQVLQVYRRHADELRSAAGEVMTLLEDLRILPAGDPGFGPGAGPGILIAVDGVACGQDLAQHLKRLVPDARNAIAYVGYQPAGTRGAALLAGKPQIKVQGDWITARAEVLALDGLSGHADRQGLIDWILSVPRAPKHVFLMHGEPEAADSLRQAIAERRSWPCSVPEYLELANIREDEALEHQGMPG